MGCVIRGHQEALKVHPPRSTWPTEVCHQRSSRGTQGSSASERHTSGTATTANLSFSERSTSCPVRLTVEVARATRWRHLGHARAARRMHSEALSGTQSHSESLRANQSLSEPLRTSQSLSGPIRVSLSHSEPLRVSLSHSEPLRVSLGQSEFIRAYPTWTTRGRRGPRAR